MQLEKMMSLPTTQENIANGKYEEPVDTRLPKFRSQRKVVLHSDKASVNRETTGSSTIKCLKDILTESQPDSPTSLHSDSCSSEEDGFPQVFPLQIESS